MVLLSPFPNFFPLRCALGRERCTIDWQSMLSTADYAAMAFVVVGAIVTAGMLLKSGIRYKRLYERYSMLEEGGEVVLDSEQLG